MIKIYTLIFVSVVGVFTQISTVFARAGGGEDFVSVDSYSSSGGTTYVSGGFSFFGLIFIVIVGFIVYSYLKKIGKWNVVKDGLTKNNIVNNSVRSNLSRGNIKGALFNAAIGGISAGIFSSLSSSSNGVNGLNGGVVDIGNEIIKIKATDPGFNEQVFKDKAQNAFFKVQEGWERQDTSIMRPFVSDSVLQRFSNQLSDLKSRGEKNILENIVIGHIDITNVRSDTSFNYITVKIDASSADYTINTEGKIIKGSKDIIGFTEYWIFLRTIGVKTDLNKQLKDSKCPNCGAALQVNATGKCEYCSAVITSGQYDWVLSEIRQA